MWRLALAVMACLVAAAGTAAADCSPQAIAAARQQFRQAYAAQDFANAEYILNTLRNDCITGKDVDPVLAAEIASDNAIAAHRSGDDDVCIEALTRYSPWQQRPPVPAMARLPERLRRAIGFNYRQCEAWCSGADNYNDVTCVSLRVQQGLDKMLPGDFAEKPCPFDTGGSPTLALPDGSCLALYAPPNGRAKSDADEKDPAGVCPRVAHVREGKGKIVSDTLDVPARSMLRRPVLCCGPVNLAIDPAGRIELTPSDNPPEDCHSGHRANPQQDIMRLRDARLVLEHRLDAAGD